MLAHAASITPSVDNVFPKLQRPSCHLREGSKATCVVEISHRKHLEDSSHPNVTKTPARLPQRTLISRERHGWACTFRCSWTLHRTTAVSLYSGVPLYFLTNLDLARQVDVQGSTDMEDAADTFTTEISVLVVVPSSRCTRTRCCDTGDVGGHEAARLPLPTGTRAGLRLHLNVSLGPTDGPVSEPVGNLV